MTRSDEMMLSAIRLRVAMQMNGRDVSVEGDRVKVSLHGVPAMAHIFACNLQEMGLMTSRDYATYMKIFDLTTNLIPQPDVLIYLRASIPTLVAQIKHRGRDYEMGIDEAYLSRLNEKYEHWINTIYKGKVLIIDKDADDFVADPAVVDKICAQLEEMIKQDK